MSLSPALQSTRASWDAATAQHNRHKGNQAAFLRSGGLTLHAEERGLLGDLTGLDVVHLQCNAGPDTLGLVRLGARATGVDLSGEATRAARALSQETGLQATFEEAEVVSWLSTTPARFDVAFASYGALPWIADPLAWMRGVHRVLRPGGRLVVVEFHPLVWSLGDALDLSGDSYFHKGPYTQPVGDYVAAGALPFARTPAPEFDNPHAATAWQHTVADLVTAVVGAGLQLTGLHEWAESPFCRLSPGLVSTGEGRWGFPEGKPAVPLLLRLTARRP